MTEIKTWKQRLEETSARTKDGHLHVSVEEIEDAMQAEIDELRAKLKALEEQKPACWIDENCLSNIESFDTTVYARGGFDYAVPLYLAAGAKHD